MDTWSDIEETEIIELKDIKDIKDIKEPLPPIKNKNKPTRTLIQIIETIFASSELQEKYSTKLTSDSINIIENLIKGSPQFFRMVENTFLRNVVKNKISSDNVPYLISIIAQLYEKLLFLNIHKDTADICSYILKFIFSVIIRENLINIDNEVNGTLLILCCDNIVDSCIKILKIQKPIPAQVTTIIPQKKKAWCC
jgi:hypothetical protein